MYLLHFHWVSVLFFVNLMQILFISGITEIVWWYDFLSFCCEHYIILYYMIVNYYNLIYFALFYTFFFEPIFYISELVRLLLMGPDTHFGKIRLNFNKRLNFTIFDIYVNESVMSWIYDQGNVSLNLFLLFVPVFLFLLLFLFYFFFLYSLSFPVFTALGNVFVLLSNMLICPSIVCLFMIYASLLASTFAFFSLWGPYVPHCSSFHNDDQNQSFVYCGCYSYSIFTDIMLHFNFFF